LPIGYGRTFADPRVNWKYQTLGSPGLNGRTMYWPRGRVVGGSSSINAWSIAAACQWISTTGATWAT
jgi:choline dehydrogenase